MISMQSLVVETPPRRAPAVRASHPATARPVAAGGPFSVWWPLLPALSVLALTAALWWPFTVDDAYITWRYAMHLAHGLGPVFNPGEAVEGYSSPAWMAVLAVAVRMGVELSAAAKVLSVACAALLVVLLYDTARRLGCRPWLAGTACAWLVLLPTWQAYLVSGMETLPFAAAVTALAVLPWRTAKLPVHGPLIALLVVAVASLRPTGMLVIVPVGLWWWLARPDPMTRRGLGVGALACGALLLARHAYYGAWVANTYLVKTPPILHWLRYHDLHTFVPAELRALRRNAFPALAEIGGIATLWCALMGAVRSWRSPVVPALACVAVLGVALQAVVPADWMPGQRFALPFYPSLVLLAALGAEWVTRQIPVDARPLAATAALVVLGFGVAGSCAVSLEWLQGQLRGTSYPPLRAEQQYLGIGRWLRTHARPGEWLLTYEIGAAGFASELPIIDHEGLVTPEIAGIIHRAGEYGPVRTGLDAAAMHRVVEWCAGRRPTWFMLRTHTMQPLAVERPVPAGIADEAIQNALLDRMGGDMVLAASFPLVGADRPGAERYLLLRRGPLTPARTSPR